MDAPDPTARKREQTALADVLGALEIGLQQELPPGPTRLLLQAMLWRCEWLGRREWGHDWLVDVYGGDLAWTAELCARVEHGEFS